MRLRLITPERLIFDGDVDSVTLPGKLGQMTILPSHSIIISELAPGTMYFKKPDRDGKEVKTTRTIGPGFLEVQEDNVVVLTTSLQDL
jgi:F-type H+-transporting ATPase subunit epsilon